MSDPTETPPDEKVQPRPSTDKARRRLLRGGIGAAPVLMTLVSRPALGGGTWGGGGAGVCTTPSGFVSMPTSQPGKQYYCLGRTPGYWKQPQHFDDWVKPFYPTTTKHHNATLFADWFTPTPYSAGTTFLDVLNLMGGPPNDVARHIVATVLNIARGWVPVLTILQVQGIWTAYMNTGGGTVGYFEPTAGVKWYHDDIVNYLLSTMPL